MRVPIYLALQTFVDGRVMFRRVTTSDVSPRFFPGGIFAKQTVEAARWIELAGNPRWEAMPDLRFLEPFEEIEL